MAKQKETDKRKRNWNIIVYPDSAPADWRSILDSYHFEWVESPLHDSDLNDDGLEKKAHWHVTMVFPGPQSYDQILDLIQPLNCPIPVICKSVKGSIRYMLHLDNPEKHQYSMSDIVSHGGFDIASYMMPTKSERYLLVGEMIQFVKDQEIDEYQDLMDYALSNRFDDWFPLLCDNSTIVVNTYISSVRHRKQGNVDYSTGEVNED